jgi:Leucine-rich repeat (LRR) protein
LLSSLENLRKLDLGGNAIKDFGPVSHVRTVNGKDLQLSTATPATAPETKTETTQDAVQDVHFKDASLRKVASLIQPGTREFDESLDFRHASINVSADWTAPATRFLHLTSLGMMNITEDFLVDERMGWDDIKSIKGIEAMVNLTGFHISYYWGNIKKLDPLAKLRNLKEITLSRQGRVNDLSPLAGLTELEELYLIALDKKQEGLDLTPLAGLVNLKKLWIKECNVTDISALKGLVNLDELNLEENRIDDISALENMTKLRELNLHKNYVSDVSALKHLPESSEVVLAFNAIEDFSPVAHIQGIAEQKEHQTLIKALGFADKRLEKLLRDELDKGKDEPITAEDIEGLTDFDVSDSKIKSLEGIQQFVNLRELDLSMNKLKDISPLSALAKLRELNLDYNKVEDIKPLSGLKKMKELRLAGNRIRDISPLAKMTKMDSLWMAGNKARDLGPLASMTALTYLDAADNVISDVSVLAGLKKLETLYIQYNCIKDLSPVEHVFDVEGDDEQMDECDEDKMQGALYTAPGGKVKMDMSKVQFDPSKVVFAGGSNIGASDIEEMREERKQSPQEHAPAAGTGHDGIQDDDDEDDDDDDDE